MARTLPQKASIAGTTLLIAGADTVVALLAGVAIFPIVFANGLEPGAGPGLVFQTLPLAFGQMPGGAFFGGLFFILLTLAAWSSAISLLEPAVTWMVENHGMGRARACFITGLAAWVLGVGSVLSFNLWSDYTLFGKTFFGVVDYLTANIMLPLGGLFIAIFAAWIMKRSATQEEFAMGDSVAYRLWRFLIRYVTPVAVLVVFVTGLRA